MGAVFLGESCFDFLGDMSDISKPVCTTCLFSRGGVYLDTLSALCFCKLFLAGTGQKNFDGDAGLLWGRDGHHVRYSYS